MALMASPRAVGRSLQLPPHPTCGSVSWFLTQALQLSHLQADMFGMRWGRSDIAPAAGCQQRQLLGLALKHMARLQHCCTPTGDTGDPEGLQLYETVLEACSFLRRSRLTTADCTFGVGVARNGAPEPAVALNNLVTLIRHPSELMNVPLHQQQNKCTTLVKNKTAAAATALQFTYPLFTANACSTSGNSNLSQTQSSSNSCPILEAAKHQDIGLPRTFSFCYQQEIESTKQTLGRNKALPEQVWIKVGEEALCKQAINKRNRGRIRQLDTNVERRALGEIQNVGEGSATTQGAWPSSEPSQPALGEQPQSGPQGGRSQRRERHNRMERDRRRRIRICCDELNLLVPFCNAETDKATTLQWTTAFLKYIQERHGDALKKEFESVFCGKTGRRLKLTRPDSLVACPAQGSLQSSPAMEIK
ncbi:transcription factor-like 5 protein [Carlito syrichta]|uniref:Transcription factor-like 5 protein n=1 Tax=Carlito syrichta TaxID=1868482 RepID=A0A1U7U685_CARSF|nr:transcription factor-like 5 protein [Carlito syrichta]